MQNSDVQDLNEGRAIAVVHGLVSYKDVFGIPHWIKFCNYKAAQEFMPSDAVQKTALSCVNYNNADNNQ